MPNVDANTQKGREEQDRWEWEGRERGNVLERKSSGDEEKQRRGGEVRREVLLVGTAGGLDRNAGQSSLPGKQVGAPRGLLDELGRPLEAENTKHTVSQESYILSISYTALQQSPDQQNKNTLWWPLARDGFTIPQNSRSSDCSASSDYCALTQHGVPGVLTGCLSGWQVK